MSIKQNIKIIREKVSEAARQSGYEPSDIIIVCVTKNRFLEEIFEVLDAGIEDIGESKVQEAQEKFSALVDYTKDIDLPFNFHMVGHLQTNKVGKALDMFSMIQSVDSLKLAQKINETSKQRQTNTDILVEVNVSCEESKFGIRADRVISLLTEICKLDFISVRGLMTMAPLATDKEESRPYFQSLRQLRDQINEVEEPLFRQRIKMDFLSMGMSQDYEIAVSEGANMLRIGTAIFEGESWRI